MGCCFGKNPEGEGHRLGSVTEGTGRITNQNNAVLSVNDEPYIDPNIDDKIREERRREREAAAKERMAKNALPKKKKTAKTSSPLKGPNTKNTMTWTL